MSFTSLVSCVFVELSPNVVKERIVLGADQTAAFLDHSMKAVGGWANLSGVVKDSEKEGRALLTR